MEFAVIGLGPAGCIFLACLPPEKLAKTVVFDTYGIVGGDLRRLYGGVVANLTCAQIAKALRRVPRWVEARLTVFEKYAPEMCPTLADVALQLEELMAPILSQVIQHGSCASIHQEVYGWRIVGEIEVLAAKVIVCTGGIPRTLDHGKPVIPLDIALTEASLASYIRPQSRVVVFGTAHSGTLILRNLRNLGCSVVAVHREAPVFRWARPHSVECPCVKLGGTGCHDSEGLKQESAAIADAIVRGEWGPQFLQVTDAALDTVLASADYVIYATGFNSRIPTIKGLGGVDVGSAYCPRTAQIAPGAWGFGLAYPAKYTKPQGGEAADVGIPGFVGHILDCLPAILGI